MTPELADFAEDATVYENAYSQGCWSVPSHGSMFTGKYPTEHKATYLSPFLGEQKTLPKLLNKEGYRTVGISSNFYVNGFTGLERGFEHFESVPKKWVPRRLQRFVGRINASLLKLPFIRQRAEKIINRSKASLKSSIYEEDRRLRDDVLERSSKLIGSDKTEFFFINFIDAHLPRSPKPEFRKEFVDEELKDIEVPKQERSVNFRNEELEQKQVRKMRQLYRADMKTVDEGFGELIELLRDKEVYNDSIIVVVADHGENLKQDSLGHLYSVEDSLTSVPLLIKYPDQSDHIKVEKNVETRKIFHTILDETDTKNLSSESLNNPLSNEKVRGEFVSAGLDLKEFQNGNKVFDSETSGDVLSYTRTDEKKVEIRKR